jgi:hypothetical protein
MRASVWNALASSGDATHKALYDKYNGSYDAYLRAKMVDACNLKGVIGLYNAKEKELTNALASCTFIGADGTTKPVYPSAYKCGFFGIATDDYSTGFEVGNWHMLSPKDIAIAFQGDNLALINLSHCAMSVSTSGANYQPFDVKRCWSLPDGNAEYAWGFNHSFGCLGIFIKYYAYQVRPVLALEEEED